MLERDHAVDEIDRSRGDRGAERPSLRSNRPLAMPALARRASASMLGEIDAHGRGEPPANARVSRPTPQP
jgi:hypothetical protein